MNTKSIPSSWLDVLREGQQQTADAHVAYQRAMTDAHTAYLQAFESTQNTLVAALSGQAPVVVERRVEGVQAPASLPPMRVDVKPVNGNGHNGNTHNGNGHNGNGHNGNGHNGHNGNGHAKPVVMPAPSALAPSVVRAVAPVIAQAAIVDARSLLLDVVADKTG